MKTVSEEIEVSTTKEEFLKLFLLEKTKALLKQKGSEKNLLLDGIFNYNSHHTETAKVHKFEGYVVKEAETGGDRRVIVELATTDDKVFTGTIRYIGYKPEENREKLLGR